jgi:hypothetical protein
VLVKPPSLRLSKSLRLPIFCIGKYRARFEQTALGEADAWIALFSDLSHRGWKNCILETTGLNSRELFLRTALPFGQMFTIRLEASRKTLYRRISFKKKIEQGGDWLFSSEFKDKYKFVRKLYKYFNYIPADIVINTGRLTKVEVCRKALKALKDDSGFSIF